MASRLFPPLLKKVLAAVILIAALVGAVIGGLWLYWGEKKFLKMARQAYESPLPAVELRHIGTALVDLRIEHVRLHQLTNDMARGAGAIEWLDGAIIVADQAGQFFKLEHRYGSPPRLTMLKARFELNREDMNAYFTSIGEKLARNRWPARVTDLLMIPDRKLLAVAHNQWHTDKNCLTVRVSTVPFAVLTSDKTLSPADLKVVFDSKPCAVTPNGHETGGRLALKDNGKLLYTVGNLGFATPDAPQLKGDPGKIVEIDLDGGTRLISSGHRNPQGLAIDKQGHIWSTEHGPYGGDELNLIIPGTDYGFPNVTLGTDYGKRHWPYSNRQGRHDGYEAPVFAWVPSIAVSSLMILDNFHERWNGDFLAGSLKTKSLHRLRFEGTRVLYHEPIRIGERIRDTIKLPDGRIALWTDSGSVMFISSTGASRVTKSIARLEPDLKKVLEQCLQCHDFERHSADREKISLFGIFGKGIAAGPQALYSAEMKGFADRHSVWTQELLDSYLANPASLVPGSPMQEYRIEDPKTRTAVIEFLKKIEQLP